MKLISSLSLISWTADQVIPFWMALKSQSTYNHSHVIWILSFCVISVLVELWREETTHWSPKTVIHQQEAT